MSNERLFRGKHTAQKWVYGVAESREEGWGIKSGGTFYKVKQKTLSKYTGFDDKNGAKIFPGDILKVIHCVGALNGLFHVVFFNAKPCVKKICVEEQFPEPLFYLEDDLMLDNLPPFCKNSMIVGNEFDNPELLRVGKFYQDII